MFLILLVEKWILQILRRKKLNFRKSNFKFIVRYLINKKNNGALLMKYLQFNKMGIEM
jgi:hypothetical protein